MCTVEYVAKPSCVRIKGDLLDRARRIGSVVVGKDVDDGRDLFVVHVRCRPGPGVVLLKAVAGLFVVSIRVPVLDHELVFVRPFASPLLLVLALCVPLQRAIIFGIAISLSFRRRDTPVVVRRVPRHLLLETIARSVVFPLVALGSGNVARSTDIALVVVAAAAAHPHRRRPRLRVVLSRCMCGMSRER
jgi:hypothetical protein